MKVVQIVQARMTSTRLPGKILKTVLGKPLLAYQVERLRRVRRANALVIATTINATDDPVAALCEQLEVPVFRGSETDVLSRYQGAALAHQADAVVRLTSDCPLIDPVVIDQVIECFEESAETLDYVSNFVSRTYPRGLDAEVFSLQALETAHREAKQPAEREHVTPYLYNHPERFSLGSVQADTDHSRHRWTVDTPEDFELIRRILEALYPDNPDFTMSDVLALLADHPDWVELNAHIVQKA